MTARDRIAIIAVASLAVVGAFWMLILGPKRDEAKELGNQVAGAQQRLTEAQAQVSASQAARAQYAANYASVARLGKAVPEDDDIPSLVYQLEKTADRSDVDFRAIRVTASGSAAPPAAAQGNGAAAAPATQAAVASAPPGTVVGEAGLPTMPFSFTFDGSFFDMAAFMGRLQDLVRIDGEKVKVGGRLLAVDGFSFGPGPGGFPDVRAAISATGFLLPASEGLTAGATAGGPATTQPAAAPSGGAAPAPAATATPKLP